MAQDDAERDTLKPAHRRAIGALLTARSITAAAEEAGCSRRTLHRWLDSPEFAAALANAENAALHAVVRQLLTHAGEAVDVLTGIMADPTARPGERTRAALGVLDNLASMRQVVSFDDRLAAIEAALHGKD